MYALSHMQSADDLYQAAGFLPPGVFADSRIDIIDIIEIQL